MKYLCLVYVDEAAFKGLSQQQKDDLDDESLANDEELRQTGHLVLAQALQPTASAMTVRVRNGRMSATNGPFAETAEHLGGIVFIEARDLNDAVRIAARIPVARLGSIEVRPVLDLAQKVRDRSAR